MQRLCKNLIISDSVTFTDGSLIINLPAGNYQNHHKYCIVVAQNIPTDATIAAPVVLTIGSGTTQYPLLTCNCGSVYAGQISSRTRYSTCVTTDLAGGAFRLIDKIPCSRCGNTVDSLPIDETVTPPATGG